MLYNGRVREDGVLAKERLHAVHYRTLQMSQYPGFSWQYQLKEKKNLLSDCFLSFADSS